MTKNTAKAPAAKAPAEKTKTAARVSLRTGEKAATPAAKASAAKAPAAPAAPAAPVGPIVRVVAQPVKPYRATSARGLYWAAVVAANGQPVATVAAAFDAPTTCPCYAPAMLKAGKPPEKGTGWLAWFAKQGLVTLA